MILGRNKRKLNQEAFYLDKDQLKILTSTNTLDISIHMVTLSHRAKGDELQV